jgi:hypothetical protein
METAYQLSRVGTASPKESRREKAFGVRNSQKPNVTFKGTSNVVTFPIAASEPRALNVTCNPTDYDAVFEIPVALLGTTKYTTYVSVDLVQPRA